MRNAIFSGYYIEILEEMIIFVCFAVIGRYMCRNYLSIQQKIMKIKSLFAAVMASAMAFVACENEKADLGTPSIALSLEEVTLEAAGGEATVDVTATRDWTVKFDETADWLVVDPASGTASADAQQVTVSALSNEGYDREVSVEFSIGMQTKYLTVKQAGPKGSADELVVYSNDMDNGKVEKVNDNWPYPDQSDAWRNEKGTGVQNVTYSSNGVSVRSVSSTNNLWFPAKGGSYLSIQNIALNSTSSLQLTFDAVHGSPNGYKKSFSTSVFKVFVSKDAQKWVELPYELTENAENEFDTASAEFTVEGVDALSITFQFLGAQDGYRLTDINLLAYEGDDAVAVDFSKAEAKDFGAGSTGGDNAGGGSTSGTEPTNLVTATIKEFLAAAESSDTWYKLTGEIINIAKEDYGNFTIKDETGEVYIYGMTSKWVGSNDKSFSKIGLKVGDTVTLGTLRGSYQGTPQGGGNKVPAFYISHVSGAGGSTPDGDDSGDDDTSDGGAAEDFESGTYSYTFEKGVIKGAGNLVLNKLAWNLDATDFTYVGFDATKGKAYSLTAKRCGFSARHNNSVGASQEIKRRYRCGKHNNVKLVTVIKSVFAYFKKTFG